MARRWTLLVILVIAALLAQPTVLAHASAPAPAGPSASDQPHTDRTVPDGPPPDRSPAGDPSSGRPLPMRVEAEPAEPARCHPGTADLVPGLRHRVLARDLPTTAQVLTPADGGQDTAARDEVPVRAARAATARERWAPGAGIAPTPALLQTFRC